jgi:TolA-binding protein
MSQHLTRKEIKRDELAQAVERTVDYASSHSQLLLKGLAVLLGAAVVAGLVITFLNQRRGNAERALAAAMQVYGAEIDAANPKPEDPAKPTFRDEAARRARAQELFQKVEASYGGSTAGRVAGVYLGRLAAEAGDLATARRRWQEFVDRDGHDPLSAQVRLNLLKLDQADGKDAAVADGLQAMLKQEGDKPMPEDVILFELGSVQEKLGKTDEALAAFQRIVDEFPQSPYVPEAQQKVSMLGSAKAAT